MRFDALRSGRYAVLKGEEFRIVRDQNGHRYLSSSEPRPGFLPQGNGYHRYWPQDDEWLECVEYSHRGTFRGIFVTVTPNVVGTLVLDLVTNDTRYPESDKDGRDAGFDFREPGLWTKIVDADDPDLDITTTRTPIDPPWFKRGKEADS